MPERRRSELDELIVYEGWDTLLKN